MIHTCDRRENPKLGLGLYLVRMLYEIRMSIRKTGRVLTAVRGAQKRYTITTVDEACRSETRPKQTLLSKTAANDITGSKYKYTVFMVRALILMRNLRRILLSYFFFQRVEIPSLLTKVAGLFRPKAKIVESRSLYIHSS